MPKGPLPTCAREGCGKTAKQPKTGRPRLFCSRSCKDAARRSRGLASGSAASKGTPGVTLIPAPEGWLAVMQVEADVAALVPLLALGSEGGKIFGVVANRFGEVHTTLDAKGFCYLLPPEHRWSWDGGVEFEAVRQKPKAEKP